MWRMRWPWLAVCLWAFVVSAAAQDKRYHLIELLTQQGERHISAKIEMIDQLPKATWTVQAPGGHRTYDTSLTESEFRELWGAVANLAVDFKQFEIPLGTTLKTHDHHIIGSVPTDSSGTGVFMVPHGTQSEPIVELVRKILALSTR